MATLYSFRSSSANGSVGGTSVVVTKPSGALAGEFLLAFGVIDANVAIATPAGWTIVGAQQVNGVVLGLTCWRKKVVQAEAASWTWTWAGAHNVEVLVACYTGLQSGAGPTNPLSTTTAAATTQNAPSQIIPDRCNQVAFGVWAAAGAATFSAPPSGFAIDAQAAGTGVAVAVASKSITGILPSGTGVLSVTSSLSVVSCGFSMYVRPLFFDVVNTSPVSANGTAGGVRITVVVDDI